MQFRNHARSARHALSVTMLAVLAACGGGGDGGSSSSSSSGSVALSGQVTDGPISGAQVCLFLDGVPARNAAGAPICSGETDAQGNYTLSIPRNLASGFLTLVATKGADIKLASTLGSVTEVFAAAGTAGTVTPANLSSASVTHLTTASFALADADHDGIVTAAELSAYAPDFAAIQKAATLIQAYIDGGQATLIGGSTNDTLALAAAAVQNKALGTTGQTADAWFDDPANAKAVADSASALAASLAKEMDGKFANYKLTQTATYQDIPPVHVANGGNSSLSCTTDRTLNVPKVHDIGVAFDAARGIVLIRSTDDNGQADYMTASYNPQTGTFSMFEADPAINTQINQTTYHYKGWGRHDGRIDAAGNIGGTFEQKAIDSWSWDSTVQECTDKGTFTIVKQ
jgi:hypothetical protein